MEEGAFRCAQPILGCYFDTSFILSRGLKDEKLGLYWARPVPKLRSRAETALIVKTSWDLKSTQVVWKIRRRCVNALGKVCEGELEYDSFTLISSALWNLYSNSVGAWLISQVGGMSCFARGMWALGM